MALAKAIELKPEVRSLVQYRTQHHWEIDPAYLALRAKTLDVGLRRLGFPDECLQPVALQQSWRPMSQATHA